MSTDRPPKPATAADVGDVMRLTYNGRLCGIESVRFGNIVGGEIVRVQIDAFLPKGWDQGPPAAHDIPPFIDEVKA